MNHTLFNCNALLDIAIYLQIGVFFMQEYGFLTIKIVLGTSEGLTQLPYACVMKNALESDNTCLLKPQQKSFI